MILGLEYKKIKRTGFIPAFIGGGLLAAAVPVLNMTFRSEMYTAVKDFPVNIIIDANWQMMAMLNILLILTCACIMYNTEFADNAMQKMCTLPVRESSLFFGKSALAAGMCALTLAIESAAVMFCSVRWFSSFDGLFYEIAKCFAFSFLLTLPALFLSLLIASMFKNIWISLGIGVICVFTASMLPSKNFILSLFPFALPFQDTAGLAGNELRKFIIAAITESIIIVVCEIVLLKARRTSE